MFLGSHSTRVDEKGRLKLPAEFRKMLADEQEFYITSLDGKRAMLYPMAEWRLKETALSKLPSMDPDRQLYEDVTGLYGQVAAMDGQGRVLLPQMLREEARITEEVLVLGKIGVQEPGYLEVVNFEMYRKELAARPLTSEVKARLAAQGI